MLNVYVDADGCPVKREVYKVVKRHQLSVTLVANAYLEIPSGDWATLVVVGAGADAADDWIAENVESADIVITTDIPLAKRCLDREARVLSPKGREFTDDDIGEALATRELLSQLREVGTMTGGPAPFADRDRSRFLQRFDQLIRDLQRGR